MHLCPVCGYDGLVLPPEDFYTCPCCGTEFGYHDAAETYVGREQQWERLRRRWYERGATWFSPVIPQPPGWDADGQLLRVIGANFRSTSLRPQFVLA